MSSLTLRPVGSSSSGIVIRSESGIISPLHRITLVDTRSGPIELTLPDAAEVPGLSFVIKDRYGSAGTGTITIYGGPDQRFNVPGETGVNIQLIDEEPSFLLSSPFESITFISDGTGYFIA